LHYEFVGQVANLPFARQVGNLPHEFAGLEELPDGFHWHDFLHSP